MSNEQHLSRRERQIMDVLHARGEATAAEVLEALPSPPSYSAVRALLPDDEQPLFEQSFAPSRPAGLEPTTRGSRSRRKRPHSSPRLFRPLASQVEALAPARR